MIRTYNKEEKQAHVEEFKRRGETIGRYVSGQRKKKSTKLFLFYLKCGINV